MRLEATDTFDVAWPDPAMADWPWLGDRMHFPEPTVQLAQHVIEAFQGRILSSPAVAFVNGYEFSFPITIPDPTPEVLQRGLAAWHDDYAPRIRAFCERVRSTDFDAMAPVELAAALDTLADDALESLRLTKVVIKAFMGPTFALIQLLEDELGVDGPVLGGTLLQGFANATASSGTGLAEMAAMAAGHPAPAAALRAGRHEGLESLPGGPAFLAAFEQYISEYGWRAESWGTLHRPTWGEDPSVPLSLIGRHLADADGGLANAAHRSGELRTEALREVESRLPAEKLAAFRELVESTRAHVAVGEDRARWQLSIIGVLRLPVLALGRRLAAQGLLDEPADAFHLDWSEAQRAAREPGTWVLETARRGKEAFAHWERLSPPPFLGMVPDLSMLPAEMLPMARHFVGFGAAQSTDRSVVKGFGASRGTVTGRARVIRHLEEADRLEPGDVMVCVTTAPPWTALFAVASAVVTDTGGVMSHSAICAREFSIPAVVGTQVGTHTIPDGATVRVDGETGTVTILAG